MADQLIQVTTDASTANPPWRVTVQAGSHHGVADEPRPAGADTGPSPFEHYLAGLGSCTAITIWMYAERKGWPLEAVSVDLSYRTGSESGHIDRTLHFVGNLDDTQRARLADIAERTPVTKVVRAGAEVATTVAAA